MKLIYLALPLCLIASCKPSASPEADQKNTGERSSSALSSSPTQKAEKAEKAQKEDVANVSEKPETPPTPPKEKKAVPVGDERFIGMLLKDAEALAKKDGVPFRVVSVDGKSGMMTMDHRPERLNFTVVAGKITKVTRG